MAPAGGDVAEAARIAVVGGGPAGATCARLLARAGARVTLFEASPSHEKPCGGGIPARALREFPELTDASLRRRVATEVLLYGPSDARVSLRLRGGLHLFRRQELDAFLRARAQVEGAEIVRARVTAARWAPSGTWDLETDEGRAGGFDHLVGADGVQGTIGRALAGPWPEGQLTLALFAYIPGVTRPEVVLKFFGGFNGYLWAFPRTDHVSVGICATSGAVPPSRLKEELHAFVEKHYPEGSLAVQELKGYFIPASPRPPRAFTARNGSHPGWSLVGDSAGFVDPLTREGIAHAMRSAVRVAAEHARGATPRTPRLDPDLSWAHGHGRSFYRREFLEGMTRLAAEAPGVGRVLADLLTGDQPYRGLKRRLIRQALPCGLEIGFRALAAVVRTVRAS
jgi:geranylgeranyl reductase family protein